MFFYAQIGFFFIGCARDRESGLCVPLLFYLVVFWVCHLKEEACEGLASVFLDCICDVFIISDVFLFCAMIFVFTQLCSFIIVLLLLLLLFPISFFLAIYTLYLVMIACLTVHWSAVFFVSIFLFIVSNI